MAGNQTAERTLTQTGGVVNHQGDTNVSTSQNQTSPQRETPIIEWTCPRKFEQIEYKGQRDATRFIPRTTETLTGSANDDTVVSLNANIQPIAGETEIADQDYPVVVAYNVTQGTQIDIADVDYSANEVTLATDPADGDSVKLWPIMSEGTVQFRVRNQIGHKLGALYPWEQPVYTWHDYPQLMRGREINLHGGATIGHNDTLQLVLDAPQKITWEDSDYPLGAYVSTIEQDAVVTL